MQLNTRAAPGNGPADAAEEVAGSPSATSTAKRGDYARQVRPILQQFCFDCHGEEKREADLRLDQLSTALDDRQAVEMWQEVQDRLVFREMPPRKAPQPSEEQLTQVTQWVAGHLKAAREARHRSSGPVIRRLNRVEYNHTIHDLVGVRFSPGDDFPADTAAHGFDNVGEALRVSPLHIRYYLDAARQIMDRAIVTGGRPEPIRFHFELEHDDWLELPDGQRGLIEAGKNRIEDGKVYLRLNQWNTGAGARMFRLPHDGWYRIRVRAGSIVPDAEQVRKWVRQNVEDKHWDEEHLQSGIYDYGPPRLKLINQDKVVIDEIDVAADESSMQVYEFEAHFASGGAALKMMNNYNLPRSIDNHRFIGKDGFPRPTLVLDWIEIEGPIYESWPPASHRRLLGDGERPEDETAYARQVLERFMPRAWRRPADAAEVEQMLGIYERVRPEAASFEEAIQAPLAAVLTSPHFLYLAEPVDPENASRPLNDHELATRLSYFLWSSQPDAKLRQLADAGRLNDDAVLAQQVERMLADPKSRRFVRNFVDQWLDLREIGKVVPDGSMFPEYDDHLQESIIQEPRAFFAEILDHDRSVLNFVESDFVTVNERLARFYGLDGVEGDAFRRVKVSPEAKRGGLLTQAGMLTLTSNGTRTSPVIRGVWILERILGDPPAPPPPDVGEIAPEVPGIDKATVRDRLEAHRELPQCASCHNKIDPLGFALENYNAIGQWRDKEGFGYKGRVGRNDPDIDASGQLPDGTSFDGPAELKQILLDREDQFLNALIEKMLTYALGRGVDAGDRPLVDELRADLKQHDYKLSRLITSVVQSEAFRSK